MEPLLGYWPHLLAMVLMMLASGFFSCSEAALFYLSRDERDTIATAGLAGQVASRLLDNPERLLSAILFWNLIINVAFFAVSSVVGIGLQREGATGIAGGLTVVTLLALILCSELLPKNLAVLFPRAISLTISLPLAAATRLLDPLMPVLQAINKGSERIIFPHFRDEKYLELSDIEQAITLSTPDMTLARLEELVLQQVVGLSDLTAEELMHPRTEQELFRPPVSIDDLLARPPSEGFALVTEDNSDEVDSVIMIDDLPDSASGSLQRYAVSLSYVPWSASAATALDILRTEGHGVAAVIDEYGHTIGTVTTQRLLQWVISPQSIDRGRMRRIGDAAKLEGGEWQVDAATPLRRIGKQFGFDVADENSITIGGLLQEQLGRLPQRGDRVEWNSLDISVLAAPRPGKLLARIRPTTEIDANESEDAQ